MGPRIVRSRSAEAERKSPIASILERRRSAPPPKPTPRQPVRPAAIVERPVHWLPTPDSPRVVAAPPFEQGPVSDLLTKSRSVPRRPRGDSLLHVSDLLYKCQRKVALVERFSMPVHGGGLTLSQELTFAQGDAIHDVIRARGATSSPGTVWGQWRCPCKTLIVGPCLASEIPETACHACGRIPSIYSEVTMPNEELGLVGNPDLILWYSSHRAFVVSELKSIAHDNWKELVRPDPDHVLQSLFYWYLMRELGYPLIDLVTVTYATKSMVFKGPCYKEYVFTPSEQIARLDPYIAEARSLKAARAGGSLPGRQCIAPTATNAKACEVCAICFATPE